MGLRLCKPGAPTRGTAGESGTAMLETVLVLPVVLLIFFGTIEFGVIFGRYQVISNAAREGAREASLFRVSCTAHDVRRDVSRTVRSRAGVLGMFPGDARVVVDGACGTRADGNVEVTVAYRHRWIILPGVSRLPFVDLVGVSAARVES